MDNKGWIKLHRCIQDNVLWQDKPFSRGQAWVDLILMANHEDNKFLLGNEWVDVKRGSFITSEHKLMDRWGWSKTKTRDFLKMLENGEMIVKNSDRKKTTITIEKYNNYQNIETTKKPKKNHEETTKRPQRDPNKKIKNDKNEKKYIYYAEKVKLTEVEYERLCDEKGKDLTDIAIQYLSDYIIEKGYKTKDHNRTLRRWVFDAVSKLPQTKQVNPAKKAQTTKQVQDIEAQLQAEKERQAEKYKGNKGSIDDLTKKFSMG